MPKATNQWYQRIRRVIMIICSGSLVSCGVVPVLHDGGADAVGAINGHGLGEFGHLDHPRPEFIAQAGGITLYTSSPRICLIAHRTAIHPA